MTTMGVDVDPAAVTAARDVAPEAEIACADALEMDWGGRTFDVVVGNPPFKGQLSRLTTRGGRSRFGGGTYADTAAEFLALALRLARPEGGRIGLILPQSILSTRDVAPIRAQVLERGAVVDFWSSRERLFDAGVRICVVVIELGRTSAVTESRPRGPTSVTARHPVCGLVDRADSWASLLFGAAPPRADGPTLGDIATFTSDFRDQYYGLVGAVGDDVDGPPLITSGLIEPGECLWGQKPVRFAKSTYAAPRVDLSELSPKLRRWAASRLVPKILIANQTRTIEAVIDRTGAWLPSVPVITCTTDRLDEVHAVLSSAAATDWVRAHAAGSGLSADAVRLAPRVLASIPLSEVLVSALSDSRNLR